LGGRPGESDDLPANQFQLLADLGVVALALGVEQAWRALD
jgi:hypothetical protein